MKRNPSLIHSPTRECVSKTIRARVNLNDTQNIHSYSFLTTNQPTNPHCVPAKLLILFNLRTCRSNLFSFVQCPPAPFFFACVVRDKQIKYNLFHVFVIPIQIQIQNPLKTQGAFFWIFFFIEPIQGSTLLQILLLRQSFSS